MPSNVGIHRENKSGAMEETSLSGASGTVEMERTHKEAYEKYLNFHTESIF